MTTSGRVRDERRAASEAGILDAAWELFARDGPDGASLRAVAAAAGCTHALVTRYYGSKAGLEAAVAAQLADRVDRSVSRSIAVADDPLADVLASARAHRTSVQLLVRSALGDLPTRGFPACLHVDELLDAALSSSGPAARTGHDDRRSRLVAYAAASLLLGYVTFEGFLVAATGLGPLAPRRRDSAMVSAAKWLLEVPGRPEPRLEHRDVSGASGLIPVRGPATSAREALLRSAVELFAERGPASVSVRDIARHARVNQGLIYRHFGSKDALLAESLEQGSAEMYPAALADDGFDFDAMSWFLHHGATTPRLIARILVDDIEISSVRTRFPTLRRLIDAYDTVPSGAGPANLSDPRVAVVATAGMALGSTIWGGYLRGQLGLGERDGIEAAIADLARLLVAAPVLARSGGGTIR